MSQQQFVLVLVGVILGSGGAGSVLAWFRFRTDKSTAVAIGAEAAVQSLILALKVADSRIEHLEGKITKLESTIDKLQSQLEETSHFQVQTTEHLTGELAVTNEKLTQVIEQQEGTTS